MWSSPEPAIAARNFAPVPISHPRGGNPPVELSTFIGRTAELARLARIQAATRLLTLVGPDGIGKTRLALRLATARQQSAYPDGVWFVELAMVSDPSAVVRAVANTVRVHPFAGESTLAALLRKLTSRDALLILDNCEHVLEECSQLAASILDVCPGVDIIATSRDPFEAAGDVIWRVPPLSLPSPRVHERSEIEASDAVQLLLDRVRARHPLFELTSENVEKLAAVCRQVAGVPLAIELAAAQLNQAWLGPESAAEVAQRRRGLRPAGRRPYRTLSAMLDRSCRLLTDADRTLLRRVTVFADGWTLHAAQSICTDEQLSADAVERCLERLVARSIVILDRKTNCATYYLHESLNQYVRAHLEKADEIPNLRNRHLQYMLTLAERVPAEAFDLAHARELASEQENLRAALGWAVEDSSADAGLRLACAMFPLWFFNGQFAEGQNWFERLLDLPLAAGSSSADRARLWLSQLLVRQGDNEHGPALLQDARRTLAREDGQNAADPVSHLMLGTTMLWHGDILGAQHLIEEAVRHLRNAGSKAEPNALLKLAVIAFELGDLRRVAAICAELEGMPQADAGYSAYLTFVKGLRAVLEGDLELAVRFFGEVGDNAVTHGERPITSDAWRELGHVHVELGMPRLARACFMKSVESAYGLGDAIRASRAFEGLARTIADEQPASAIRLCAAADRLRKAHCAAARPTDLRRLETWLAAAQHALGDRAFRSAWQAGRRMTIDEVLVFARSLSQPQDTASSNRGRLTSRERQVLSLLARGFSTYQIASELAIRNATARTHVERILSKLGVHSRTQAAAWANEHQYA